MADAGLPWSIPNAGFSIQPINGEFAAWSRGSSVPPDGWSVLSGTWSATLSRCQGGTGPYAVDFGQAGIPSTLVSDYIVVLPNTRYLLSALYRIVTGSGAALSQGVRVDWYDDSRSLISSNNVDLITNTAGVWTYSGLDITSPIQAVYAKVVVGRFNVNGSTNLQVDAIKLDRAVYIPSGVISLDDVTDGVTYARPRGAYMSGGIINAVVRGAGTVVTDFLFKKPNIADPDTLDGVPDSATYGKVKNTMLTAGEVTSLSRGGNTYATSTFFQKALDNLDNVLDGITYGRPKLDGLNASGYPLLDKVVDGALFRRVGVGYVDASNRITGVLRGSSPVAGADLFAKTIDTLDNITNGTVSAKVNASALSAGNPKTDSLVDGTYAKVLATQLTSGAITSLTRGGVSYATTTFFNTGLDTLDNVPNGTTYARVNASALSSGNPKTDSLVDGTYSKVAATYVDATSKAITTIRNTTLNVDIAGSAVFRKSTDTLDDVAEGTTYKRLLAGAVTSGYPSSVWRDGASLATSSLFKKSSDTLDSVLDGTTYARVNATALSSGNPKMDSVVDGTSYRKVAVAYVNASNQITAVRRAGADESVDNLFKKSSDTFASVAGTLSDGQLGSNVVNTSNIKNANITTAKVADLAVTSDKLDNGISLSAHDEETVAGISSRTTATNATKGAWDGATNYIRLTLAVGSTNPQLSTGLATGTSTNLKTTHAIMRYRISGGASGAVTKLEAINTANVAQKSSTVFLADDSWHTAVFDISGWATAGTLRIDLTTSALGSTGYWDVAYIATGIPGGGTGALISKAGNVGVGVASPTSKLHVDGTITIGTTTSTYQAGALGYTDSNWGFIYRPPLAGAIAAHNFEAYDGSDLLTITNSGNVGIGTTSPGGYRLTVNGPAAGTAAAPASLSTPGAAQGERSALALFGTFQSTPGDNAPRRTADVVAGFNGGNWGAEYLSLNVGNNGSSNDTQVLTSEKVRIQSNGNVGIGISAPRTTLHAYGTSNTPSGSGTTEKAIFIVEGSATNAIKMGTDPASPYGSWMQSTDKTNNGIQYPLLLNPVGGKVGINTTAPEEQLEIKTAAAAYGLLHSDGTRKVGSYVDTTGGWYGTKSNHDLHLFTNNGAKRLTVTTGGNIDIASFGTPGSETHVCSDTTGVLVLCSASDERKKEKIETLPAALRMVLQLRPVRYEWKDKGRMGKGQDVGFIAQEVMPLFPELVGLNSDGTYLLHYDKFAPILVSAIQELYDDRAWLARRVQALEDKAEAAEKRLSDLEARLARLEAKQ